MLQFISKIFRNKTPSPSSISLTFFILLPHFAVIGIAIARALWPIIQFQRGCFVLQAFVASFDGLRIQSVAFLPVALFVCLMRDYRKINYIIIRNARCQHPQQQQQ